MPAQNLTLAMELEKNLAALGDAKHDHQIEDCVRSVLSFDMDLVRETRKDELSTCYARAQAAAIAAMKKMGLGSVRERVAKDILSSASRSHLFDVLPSKDKAGHVQSAYDAVKPLLHPSVITEFLIDVSNGYHVDNPVGLLGEDRLKEAGCLVLENNRNLLLERKQASGRSDMSLKQQARIMRVFTATQAEDVQNVYRQKAMDRMADAAASMEDYNSSTNNWGAEDVGDMMQNADLLAMLTEQQRVDYLFAGQNALLAAKPDVQAEPIIWEIKEPSVIEAIAETMNNPVVLDVLPEKARSIFIQNAYTKLVEYREAAAAVKPKFYARVFDQTLNNEKLIPHLTEKQLQAEGLLVLGGQTGEQLQRQARVMELFLTNKGAAEKLAYLQRVQAESQIIDAAFVASGADMGTLNRLMERQQDLDVLKGLAVKLAA